MQQDTVPASKIRKVIAKRMTQSWHTSPRVSYTITLDAQHLIDLRRSFNQQVEDAAGKISYNGLIMKACATALMEFPEVNAYFDGETITYNHSANIGFAVDTEGGLMVPNIKSVQGKDFATLAHEMFSTIQRAQGGKLKIDDMSGGTFTITNLGGFGIEHATPIINPPELAILGVFKIQDTPVAVDGQVAVRPILTLVLTADHRLIDGVLASRFLARLKQLLEGGLQP